MATTQADLDQIKQRQQEAANLNRGAAETEAGALTFEDDVMEGVRKHRAERGVGMLQNEEATVTGRIGNYAEPIIERMGTDIQPRKVDAVIARERQGLLEELAWIARQQENEQGFVDKVIAAGGNRLLAEAAVMKARAMEMAEQADNDFRMYQQRKAEEQQTFENTMTEKEYALKVQEANKPSGSGGGAQGRSDDYYSEIQGLLVDLSQYEGKDKESYKKRMADIIAMKYGKTPQEVYSSIGYSVPKKTTKKTANSKTTKSTGSSNPLSWIMDSSMSQDSATLKR